MRRQQFISSFITVIAISNLPATVMLMPGLANSTSAWRPSALATFSSQDKSGCITSETSVFVHKGDDNQEQLDLRILKADECNDVALLNINEKVSLPAGSLRVWPDLSFAALDAAVNVTDQQSRTRSTATIHLKWKAWEKAVAGMRGDELMGLGKFVRMKQPTMLAMRLARVTGVISLPGTRIALGTAPGTADTAWISSAQGGIAANP